MSMFFWRLSSHPVIALSTVSNRNEMRLVAFLELASVPDINGKSVEILVVDILMSVEAEADEVVGVPVGALIEYLSES
ncbi:hypothetical protein CEP53_004327 [Fusarium sp. AF-6]|nr:hypothetical protein CEP53_004327 [Fusarium sp. AF-6]